MKRRILFGTRNQAKVDAFRVFLASLPVEILSPGDFGIDIDVREDGKSPEENAEKKAKAYYAESNIPTFAIDAGLYVEKFPDEKQPGVFVRRIYGADREATDQEILDYYVRELEQVGGESKCVWRVAMAIATSDDTVLSRSFSFKTMLASKPSDVLIPDAPIGSLMVDPATGTYYSEIAYDEWPDAKWFLEMMQQYLESSV